MEYKLIKIRRLTYEQSKKMQEEVRSRHKSPKPGVEEGTPKTPEETVEEIVARVKKQTEERFQKYSVNGPLQSPTTGIADSDLAQVEVCQYN
jgi:hypothetical protein